MKTLKFIILLLTAFPLTALSNEQVIEKEINYTVEKEDMGAIIEGKLGLNWSYIAAVNSINPNTRLRKGQVLKAKFMRIVPMTVENGLVINIPDRTLYRFVDGKLKDYYFIAAGKPTWPTELGEFTVVVKVKDPTWHVPPSIQKEMEDSGEEVLLEVPPGPDNPLGKYWIQLSLEGLGLHSTNKPHSIYKLRSHGCMRLRPEVAEFLYNDLPVGTKGRIIYEPVKIAQTADGRILLEVYRDFYKRKIKYKDRINAKLKELNASEKVDWNKIDEALKKKDGLVMDVTADQKSALKQPAQIGTEKIRN